MSFFSSRPIVCRIRLSALQANLARLRGALPAGSQLLATVKAQAYGHGLDRLMPALAQADGLALLDIGEAIHLRQQGWHQPILLLEGAFSSEDMVLCAQWNLWHVLHSTQQLDWLKASESEAEAEANNKHHVFLKLNTGMNRLGFSPDVLSGISAQVKVCPHVEKITLMTHFACADQTDGRGLEAAWTCFQRTTQPLLETEPSLTTSLANSAVLLREGPGPRGRAICGDWVRAGIALYGSSPDPQSHTANDWGLVPVMTLQAQIIAVQEVPEGEQVGYGATFTAMRPMRIGVVACGYADGYPRHALNAPVWLEGHRSATVGRVSMDMLTIDLTPCPQAGIGTWVTLWGQNPDGSVLSVDEVAQAASTIGYELLCALAPRVPVLIA